MLRCTPFLEGGSSAFRYFLTKKQNHIMSQKVGFVGVGRMGANMARRLKDCGYDVSAVYDIRSEAATELAT